MDLTAHVPQNIIDLLSTFLPNRRAEVGQLRQALEKDDWARLQHLAEHVREDGQRVVRVEPARVREHPHARVPDALVLQSELRLGPAERRAIRRDTEYREEVRTIAHELGLQRASSAPQFRFR